MPNFVVMRGIPGSGKSTLARRVINTYASTLLYLNPDEINQQSPEFSQFCAQQIASLVPGKTISSKNMLYRFLLQNAQDALNSGIDVIWDQPWSNIAGLQYTIEVLRHSTEYVNLTIIEVEIEPSIARGRVQMRKANGGHGPSEDSMTGFINKYEDINTLGGDIRIIRANADSNPAKIIELLTNNEIKPEGFLGETFTN